MNLQVILRHELLRRLPKLVVLTFAVVTLVLGIITFRDADSGDGQLLENGTGVLVQVFVFLSACMVLFIPEAGRRCRPHELTLPLPGRFWWRGHFFSLLLAGLALMMVYAVIPIFILVMDRALDFSAVLLIEDQPILASWALFFWRLWGPPVLFFLVVVNIISLWWPQSALPGKNPGWLKRLILLVALSTLAMAVTSHFNVAPVIVVVLAGLAMANIRLKVPEALEMPEDGSTWDEISWQVGDSGSSSSTLVHTTVMRVLFKWPANWIALLPMTLFFGLIMGGFNPITDSPDSLRFAHIFMSAYVMVAGAGFFAEKMYLLDPLPIDRKIMLGWLVWPSILAMVIGYGAGQWLQTRQIAGQDVFSYVVEEQGYGLRVPPREFLVIKAAEAPMITAPWGESHQAQSVDVWKGLPWLLYKPYSTPEGASLRYVAWQLQRAIEAVYHEELTEQQILDGNYLIEKDGRIEMGEQGLNLLDDHPQWRPVTAGPVFPWLMGVVFLLYLGSLSLYFRLMRRQVNMVRKNVIFWGMMILLLGLHMGSMAIFIVGWTDDWILSGLIQGSIQRWSEGFSLALPLAYGALAVLLAGSWQMALHQFRKMEPPRC